MTKSFLSSIITLSLFVWTSSCTSDPNMFDPDFPGDTPGGFPGGNGTSDGLVPAIGTEIVPYSGQRATDASKDIIGTDEDLYWEVNKFENKVTVFYDGDIAKVTSTNDDIITYVSDADVVIDMLSNSVSGVEITLSGKSDDGSLKIYGEKKLLLTLDGVELKSQKGPAINNQCKKRMFVNLVDGTENNLSDATFYEPDIFYPEGIEPEDEDRKGCLFSEGNLIFSGYGTLIIEGNMRHGIATDGYFFMRPGTTVAVVNSVQNALHAKGEKSTGMGINIEGGLFYGLTSGDAGKAFKTDYNVEIAGGTLELYTSGDAIYDTDEKDTSSSAGIKADGNVMIAGGDITIKSTGKGGKGINVDGDLSMTDGSLTVATSGGKFLYNSSLDSSPKGVKADGNIVIDGGNIYVASVGISDGTEGIESKSTLTVNGGELYIYAYDDAINASNSVVINGGRIFAYSVNNDGIDSNGTLTVNGGVVVASGAGAPEEAFDCDNSQRFLVNGGMLIGTSGAAISPSTSSKQHTVIYNGVQAKSGQLISIADSNENTLVAYSVPRTYGSMSFFFSSPSLENGTYALMLGGTPSSTASWYGWFENSSVSGASSVGSFNVSGIVTTVGKQSGPGGRNQND